MNAIRALHERLEHWTAQGLLHLAAADLNAPIQEFFALKLTQPAALLTNLQQHVTDYAVTEADSDTFIKVLHTLKQVEIQLSAAGMVDKQALMPLSSPSAVYLQRDQLLSADTPELRDMRALLAIIAVSNPFARRQRLRAYLQQASPNELRQSIDIAWCDSTLSQTIASALQSRPDDALALAQIALEHPNLVIQWTGIQALIQVSALDSHQAAALGILQAHRDYLSEGSRRSQQEALRYVLEDAMARASRQYAAYQSDMQRLCDSYKHNVQWLRSAKKGEQQTGIHGLAQSRQPYFAPILAEALASDDERIVKKALEGLFEIRGFAALPDIIRLLDGPHAKAAIETLTDFGDRSVLRYIFAHLDTKTIPAHFRDALRRFGDLLIPPLCAALKRLDNPAAYKPALSSILATVRSDDLVQILSAEAEADPAYADRLVTLLQGLYPKQINAPKKKNAPSLDFTIIKPLLPMLMGGRILPVRQTAMFRVTPDNRRLVVLPHGQAQQVAATIFEMTTWQAEAVLPITNYPTFMAVMPDGQHVLIAAHVSREQGYQIDTWDVVGRPVLVRSFLHPEPVNSSTLSVDGQRLFIGGESQLNVVEFPSDKPITSLSGHQQRIMFLTSIPEQRLVLSGDWQGWLQAWDDVTLQPVARVKSDSWHPRFASLSTDRKLLIYAGHIGVHIWETQGWREIFAQPKPNNIDCMALVPDGKHLLLGIQKKLRILKLDTLKEIFTFESDTLIGHIEITADGQHLITFGQNGLRVWHVDINSIIFR